ncbi:MAG: hypothetical protein ACR2MN_01515 [Acidimicrobiales bacterium]
MLVEEIDHALRPAVHERRVPSGGTILEPTADSATWASGTQLDITRMPLDQQPLAAARRFADGLSTWLLRRTDGTTEWVLFDRPTGSERDLVVLASRLEATIVQRHPAGSVRVVGSFGVLRWGGFTWSHEPPVSDWIDVVTASPVHGDPEVVKALLAFAVHDLGSMGIGSLLIYRPGTEPGPPVEGRLPTPPPLQIRRASHLAPLRHALGQVDGRRHLRPRRGPAPARGTSGAEPGRRSQRRGARRHPSYLRAPLQLRRPPGHRDRSERGRPGLHPPSRRDAGSLGHPGLRDPGFGRMSQVLPTIEDHAAGTGVTCRSWLGRDGRRLPSGHSRLVPASIS